MSQTVHEFGGEGVPLHLAVANGFPPGAYAPLASALTARCRVFSLPPRPLWRNPPPPASIADWAALADDLLAAFEQQHLDSVIAAGHSFGGVISLIAAARTPARFRALILLDPTLFVPAFFAQIEALRRNSDPARLPLVEGALNRRAHFSDRAEAFRYWRAKPLFYDWDDDALRCYVEAATTPAPGGGFTLVWSPAWEARIFATVQTDTWDYVDRLPAALPILLVRGSDSQTMRSEAATLMREKLANLDYAEIAGGHLFPHSAPNETARVMLEWLDGRGLL